MKFIACMGEMNRKSVTDTVSWAQFMYDAFNFNFGLFQRCIVNTEVISEWKRNIEKNLSIE